MVKTRCLAYLLILTLFLSSVSCATLQRKFTRKKKEEKQIGPVITSICDYSKDLRVDELYKKYFLFWKTWQTELIERMEATYKKRIDCYDHTLDSLIEMKKYLANSKAEELQAFIIQIESLDPDIRKRRLTKSQIFRMRQLLEKTKRQIDRNFSYSDVKEFLELRR